MATCRIRDLAKELDVPWSVVEIGTCMVFRSMERGHQVLDRKAALTAMLNLFKRKIALNIQHKASVSKNVKRDEVNGVYQERADMWKKRYAKCAKLLEAEDGVSGNDPG